MYRVVKFIKHLHVSFHHSYRSMFL